MLSKEDFKDPDLLEKNLQKKDPEISIREAIDASSRLSKEKTALDQARAYLNSASKEIGEKKRKGEDVSNILEKVTSCKKEVHALQESTLHWEKKSSDLLSELPNVPDGDVPVSLNPEDNVCVKTEGSKQTFNFTPKNHVEIAESLQFLDFPRGAKISGRGFPVYTGQGALLEWALLSLMIDTHVENGFTFHLLPHMVRPEIMYGGGQLPKFQHQLFHLEDEDFPLYLLPTAEIALNGLHSDEIFAEKDLPKLYVAYTPCFRREAGAAGAKERGLIRVHQFNKVELFAFCTPEMSDEIFDKMLLSAEEVLQKLDLHYRNMLLVTGDLSFGAARTVDIEVFLPGQDRYYEVSSVSNCRSFQARRSKTRYKGSTGKIHHVHTLNGSGLATARLMAALLENNQKEDGSITIPEVLRPYMLGKPTTARS